MSDDATGGSGRLLLANFGWMSLCFSVNHGTVVTMVSLTSSILDASLASASLTLFYACYTLTALLVSVPVVTLLKPKGGLLAGTGIYCMYTASFAIARRWPATTTPAIVAGAVLGGLAAGFLWTAQGAYFTLNARAYALATGRSTTSATNHFSALFATLYLATELAVKLLATLSPDLTWLSIAAVGSAAALTLIAPLADAEAPCDESPSAEPSPADAQAAPDALAPDAARRCCPAGLGSRLTAALSLFGADARARLLAPLSLTFGFAAALLTQHVNGEVVKPTLGVDGVLYLTSLTAGLAGVAQLPLSAAAACVGKRHIITLGGVAFAVMGGAFAFAESRMPAHDADAPPIAAAAWWALLGAVYALQGLGRAVWEGIFKSRIADMFPRQVRVVAVLLLKCNRSTEFHL